MKQIFFGLFALVMASYSEAHPPSAVYFRPCFCPCEAQCFPMQSWNPFYGMGMGSPMMIPVSQPSPYCHPAARRIILTLHRAGTNDSQLFNTTAFEAEVSTDSPVTTETSETAETNAEPIPQQETETTGIPSTIEPVNSMENMIPKDDTPFRFVSLGKNEDEKKSVTKSDTKPETNSKPLKPSV